MATRPVLGAALVGACTAARAAALATAESESAAPAQPPRNSPATVKQAELPRTDVDLARAIAVMERYHRMSQEALRANATDVGGGSGGPEVLVSAGGELAEKAEAESSGAGNMALSLSVPPVEVEAGATGEAVHVPETVSPELGGVGTVATPAAVDDAVAVVAPPPQPVAPKPKKKKLPRIPAERLFSQFDAGGDVCVPHVIVGGGTAAWSAVQAIRRRDPTSAILVVTEEPFYPYNRTPLSKELWAPGAGGLFTSEAGTRGALEYSYLDVKKPGGEGADTEGVEGQTEGGSSPVSILRSTAVVGLDIDARTVSLANGHQVQYDKLLLATGGTPRSAASVCDALEANEDVRRAVSVFRTLEDFRELRSELGPPGSSVAVVGGGFLGTELAVAMASEGRRVSLLCAEPGVLYKVLPRYLSQFLARRLEDAGVNVVESAVVVDANCVSEKDQRVLLSLGGADDELGLGPVDKVVVCTGIVPRVELAASAGLEVDSRNGGIVVNDQMNAEANVFVAGDVASFWDRALGRRRVEHWDHAVVSGKIAGDRMAGGDSRYGLQSMFWSDLDNVGVSFSAVGLVEHDLATVSVWNLEAPPFEHAPSANKYSEGVVWYLKNNVVVGAVLWNLHDRKSLAVARKAIATKRKVLDDGDAKSILLLSDSEHSAVVRTEAHEVEIL